MRFLIIVLGGFTILPAAGAGILWQILVDQFNFGRRVADRHMDQVAFDMDKKGGA